MFFGLGYLVRLEMLLWGKTTVGQKWCTTGPWNVHLNLLGDQGLLPIFTFLGRWSFSRVLGADS